MPMGNSNVAKVIQLVTAPSGLEPSVYDPASESLATTGTQQVASGTPSGAPAIAGGTPNPKASQLT